MADLGHRVGRRLGLILCTVALAACAASPGSASRAPAHPTAVAACSDALGDGWRVAVEEDRTDSSALVLVQGDATATCQTWPSAEGTDFANTVTSVGTYPGSSPLSLAYLTSSRTGRLAPFFVGRVPPSARAVRVTFADGSEQSAILGGGLWLAWPAGANAVEPTRIEALDASGAVVSQPADPDSIQPAS
jgi:hypothetical protein